MATKHDDAATLRQKVSELQKANNYLTKANKVRARVRIVLQAHAAADVLAIHHLAGWRTGRESAKAYGLSDRKWHYGRALLQVAQVVGYGDQGWLMDDPDQIEAAISAAVERCKRNPEMLISRLPPSRQLTPAAKLQRKSGR